MTATERVKDHLRKKPKRNRPRDFLSAARADNGYGSYTAAAISRTRKRTCKESFLGAPSRCDGESKCLLYLSCEIDIQLKPLLCYG